MCVTGLHSSKHNETPGVILIVSYVGGASTQSDLRYQIMRSQRRAHESLAWRSTTINVSVAEDRCLPHAYFEDRAVHGAEGTDLNKVVAKLSTVLGPRLCLARPLCLIVLINY